MNVKNQYCSFCFEELPASGSTCSHCGETIHKTMRSTAELFKYVKRSLSDKFEVIREIRNTRDLILYEAKRRDNFSSVTLQVLHPDLTTAMQRQGFLKINEITASLNHENILRIYDYGVINDIYYAVSEPWQGESLNEYLKQKGHLDDGECIAILKRIAAGVQYAHRKGIIHGHLKPGSIVFDDEGVPKVNGFSSRMSINNIPIIILDSYSSPEQIKGYVFNARTDVYALALVFYHCLTGSLPTQLVNPLRLIYESDLIINWNNESIEQYKAVLQKALSVLPEERYASVESFITALDGAQKIQTPCPVCGSLKATERFTCPECGRENICNSHKTNEGICEECAAIRQETAKNIERRNESKLTESYLQENQNHIETGTYRNEIQRTGHASAEESGILDSQPQTSYNTETKRKTKNSNKVNSSNKLIHKIFILATFAIILLIFFRVNPLTNKLASEQDLLNKAKKAYVAGNYEAAISKFKSLIENYPEGKHSPEALFFIGYIYENDLRDYEKAKKYFKLFLSRYPRHELVDDVKYELKMIDEKTDGLPFLK